MLSSVADSPVGMRLRVICLSPRTNPTRLPTGRSRETVGALHQLRQPLSYTDGLTAAWDPPTVTVTTRPAGCRFMHRYKLLSTSCTALPRAGRTCFWTTCRPGNNSSCKRHRHRYSEETDNARRVRADSGLRTRRARTTSATTSRPIISSGADD